MNGIFFVTNRRLEVNMLIAICDDEPLFCETLKGKIYDYSNKNNLDTCIDIFHDGQALLNKNREYDIVFLDYQMPNINGLEAAKELRKKNMLSMIVFISSFPEVVYKTFLYDTFRFLVKPLKDEDLTVNDSFHCTKSINKVYRLLPSNCFFLTHRSFIVSFNSIVSFDKNSIKLINGEIAKISRDRYLKFLDALNTYYSDNTI